MPAGVTWPKYLTTCAAALLSMFAGSQAVHLYYRPLDDLDKLVDQEFEKKMKMIQESKKVNM